jgi:hypothetical protein
VVAGILSAATHLRWGPFTFAASVVLLWLVAALVGRLLRRRPERTDGAVLASLIGVAFAFAAVAVAFVAATGSPAAFPQHPDTIFHLGASQWMLDHGDISTLHAGGFSRPSGTGFYPAGFHALVVTVSSLTGAPVVVSASSVALVTAGLIWPLGCVMLARTTFGPSVRVTLAAAVASVAFCAFPFWLMGYGVLWPNVLGQALLPAALGCLLRVTTPDACDNGRSGTAQGSWQAVNLPASRTRAAVVLAAILPGLGVAHPNAVVAFTLLAYCIVAEATLTRVWQARRRRSHEMRAPLAAFAVVSALAALGWAATTTISVGMRASNPLGPEAPPAEAVLDTLAYGPRGLPHLWLVALLAMVGAVLILVRGSRQRWVVVSLALCSLLYLLLVAVDSPLTRLLTWPWYNNSPRLAALMVLPAVLTTTAALSWLAATLARRVDGLSRIPAAVVLPVLFVLLTAGGYVREHRDILATYFDPPASGSWASTEELRALRTLSSKVEPGAVVAANPWNGGSYLYLVSGRRMLFPTEKSLDSPDRQLMARRLDEAAESPRVCAAARRQEVRYALTGGTPAGKGKGYARFKGVDNVGGSSAFRELAAAGPYRLYELVHCAGH